MILSAQQKLTPSLPDPSHPIRVVANHNATIIVQDKNAQIFRCVARKKLGTVVAGDWVQIEKQANGHAAIVSIAPRSGVLQRPDRWGNLKPVASNLTRLLIVSAVKPGIDTLLIDSYCSAVERAGIEPGFIINKADILDEKTHNEVAALLDDYRRIGYQVALFSSKQAADTAELMPLLHAQTSVLVGQSGVGKSSIVNRILPDKAIRTGVLSAASGQGGHTTTATTLYNLKNGGCLIDSPGVREFSLGKISPAELSRTFREFVSYAGSCRFNNCVHNNEPECAVQQAIAEQKIAASRYRSYLTLLEKNT